MVLKQKNPPKTEKTTLKKCENKQTRGCLPLQQEAEYSFWGFNATNKQTNKAEDEAVSRSTWWISGNPGR